MKYYYRVTKNGVPIPGSNFRSSKKPKGAYFRELIPQFKYCCDPDLQMPTSTGDKDKYFVRLNESNAPISGSLRRVKNRLTLGNYQEVFKDNCCPVVSLIIVPDTSTLDVGETQTYNVIGVYASGKTKDITEDTEFTSSDTDVATITGNEATAISGGNTTIMGDYNGVIGTSSLTVNFEAIVNSVIVTPPTASITTEDTQQLTATVDVSGGAAQTVVWTSSDEAIATVSNSGLVTPISDGEVTITATSTVDNTKSDDSVITITLPA